MEQVLEKIKGKTRTRIFYAKDIYVDKKEMCIIERESFPALLSLPLKKNIYSCHIISNPSNCAMNYSVPIIYESYICIRVLSVFPGYDHMSNTSMYTDPGMYPSCCQPRERINKRVSERGGWPMQIYAHTLRVKTRRERERKKRKEGKETRRF